MFNENHGKGDLMLQVDKDSSVAIADLIYKIANSYQNGELKPCQNDYRESVLGPSFGVDPAKIKDFPTDIVIRYFDKKLGGRPLPWQRSRSVNCEIVERKLIFFPQLRALKITLIGDITDSKEKEVILFSGGGIDIL